ncbi:hypothetical protein M378DRAFT_19109 [Amanita muscaria Koide BX008]|uniref:Uncharacterized protein n=1 Tax=Amanita muscaria (strain Koide BX008) TaxID=946122 RepID=A0A0C2SJD1_AMAMK|nr:hypothetical protein M378DRAFT_19310 [Amanita muscaria Koide BX008]KIL54228.1 hypothetical protein M378DRAFT_19109 [Amanita muscaria Koide BX008]
MTYDEYLAVRGVWVSEWCRQYNSAFSEREREKVNQTPAVEAALKSSKHWRKKWSKMNLRDKWLVALYGEQLVDKFGALDVVDANLIPLGMVELFKRSRIQLDQ